MHVSVFCVINDAVIGSRDRILNRSTEYQFTFQPLRDMDSLAGEWRALEERGNRSPFLAWSWIGCWLATLPPAFEPWVLRGEREGRVCLFAILFRAVRRRHGWLTSRGLFLNQTGNPDYDTLTVEYNGFLTDPASRDDAGVAAIDFIHTVAPVWDELYVNGVEEEEGLALVPPGRRRHLISRQPAPFVDLAQIRDRGTPYLDHLSRNTRYQLRRAIRRYEERGPLVTDIAENSDQALEYMAGLKQLHQAHWTARGNPGAFANPYFKKFHTEFVRSMAQSGAAEIIRIRAGEDIIGYLYNFFYRDRVYNYQGGFSYEPDQSALKPGLVSHVLAIEAAVRQGRERYEFLAGGARYKTSLSTDMAHLTWLSLRQPCLKFVLEDGLRNLSARVKKAVSPVSDGKMKC